MKILQILVLIFSLTVLGNAQTAILSGTIYGASGAVIPKAKLTAINQKEEKFETATNDEGFYLLKLPFNLPDTKIKIARYEITVDLQNRGFEKFVLKDFRFVPSYKGKMNLDIALDSLNPEPCGYSGADCLPTTPIKTDTRKISNKISKRPLQKLPKKPNKNNKE